MKKKKPAAKKEIKDSEPDVTQRGSDSKSNAAPPAPPKLTRAQVKKQEQDMLNQAEEDLHLKREAMFHVNQAEEHCYLANDFETV